jgi:hypothetical protein
LQRRVSMFAKRLQRQQHQGARAGKAARTSAPTKGRPAYAAASSSPLALRCQT